MEASRRHEDDQLPLEGGAGAVRAIGDRLVIEALTVHDERAARLVRERQETGCDPGETVADVIEVGARVLDSQQTAANVDYVKRELQQELGALGQELQQTLEAGKGDLAERIAASFGADRSDSVQQQIKELVGTHLDQRVGELTRLLSTEDASNPLVAVQARATKAMMESEERHRKQLGELRESHSHEARAMQTQISGLQEKLGRLLEKQEGEALLAEAEEAGTRKGRSFEERVHAGLERIAAGRGDLAEHTGFESNEAGSKKGDSVVEIGAADGPSRGRIVFEAKDKRLSKQDTRRELTGALEQRDAEFAVLVVAGEERVPDRHEPLQEFEGNKMVVAVDRDEADCVALEYAYRYARARTLMAAEADLAVDAAGVRAAAERARAQLKELQKARRSLTAISDGATSVRETIDSLDEAIHEQLEQIESLIDAAE